MAIVWGNTRPGITLSWGGAVRGLERWCKADFRTGLCRTQEILTRQIEPIKPRIKFPPGSKPVRPYPSSVCCGIWAWTARDRGIPVWYYNDKVRPFFMMDTYVNGKNQLVVNLNKTFYMGKKKKSTKRSCVGINPNDPRYRFSC